MTRELFFLPVALCGVVVGCSLVGCGTSPPAGTPTQPTQRERSRFFLALSDEPKSGLMKARFESKFPAHTFQVVATDVTSSPPTADEPLPTKIVKVTLLVKKPTPEYDKDRLQILNELETYLEEQMAANGLDLNGPIQETDWLDGKGKVGFFFGYRSESYKGAVVVIHPSYVPGATEVKIVEQD